MVLAGGGLEWPRTVMIINMIINSIKVKDAYWETGVQWTCPPQLSPQPICLVEAGFHNKVVKGAVS